jgi:hypothetical protein
VKQLTSSRQFWRWVLLAVYLGLLYWMGAVKLHRSHPAMFFEFLVILTAALVLSYWYTYRGQKKV